MPSLLRTHTEQLNWTSIRKKSMGKTVGKRMWGVPRCWGGSPRRILFLTDFTILFARRVDTKKRQHFGTRLVWATNSSEQSWALNFRFFRHAFKAPGTTQILSLNEWRPADPCQLDNVRDYFAQLAEEGAFFFWTQRPPGVLPFSECISPKQD